MADTYANPNVDPLVASSMSAPQGTPVSQTPTTPAPTLPTPAAQSLVNPNQAFTTPTLPGSTPAGTTAPAGTPTTPAQTPQNASGSLVMPQSGSVVDLLNMAGQSSDYASRQQLAQQYGIQNYSGTAAQNQDLAKKYLDAFNAKKGTATPETGAEARNALSDVAQGSKKEQAPQDPTKAFMDMYANMNPVEASLFTQLSGLLSSTQNQQSLTDFYKQEVAAQGLPDLNLQMADLNKIMDGTEDDIRSEISNAGGFATESQVQAMTAARNKTLIRQANYLQNVINSKKDYVDRIVSLTQADREQVGKDLDRKLGITNTLVSMANRMEDNAKENYKAIVDSVGWGGLATAVKDNPQQAAKVEKMFGLAPGELKQLGQYQKPLTAKEQVDLENAKLQGQKLKQEIAQGPTVNTQVVDLGGKKVLINTKTGAIVSDLSNNLPKQVGVQLAQQQQTIQDTDNLLNAPGLTSAVGPNTLARLGPIASFSGAKSNFIGSVEQLTQQLTLDQLVNAKAQGATFGALSEGELKLLSATASKINSWAIKDGAGNVTGYNIDEDNFKKELDKINNFQKLDFVLKGGDPASVSVKSMDDGTLWTKNSDGTYTKIH